MDSHTQKRIKELEGMIDHLKGKMKTLGFIVALSFVVSIGSIAVSMLMGL